MPELILAAVTYGGYFDPVKLVVFLIMFFGFLPVINWIGNDSQQVNTNYTLWSAVSIGALIVGTFLWLLVPTFFVGLAIYALAVGGVSIAYVIHRNSHVQEFERILTPDHISGLIRKQRKSESFKNFVFYSSNKNEVPIPHPKTSEFQGYKTAYRVLNDAVWRRAERINLIPSEGYKVQYLVDGVQMPQPEIPVEEKDNFAHFLKLLGDLDLKERRKPQKSKFVTEKDGKKTDWELITAGSTAGEQIQIKKLIGSDILPLEETGLSREHVAQLKELAREHSHGVFLACGPKKSGVTTTFYSLVRNHDAFLNSIQTLEKEPIADLPNVTQELFSLSDTGTTTYDHRLRTIIRMGPDILGVADCDDTPTAKLACKAGTEKVLVYVIINADSAVKGLAKWMKLVGDKKLVSESFLGISSQLLIRKLCNECKQGYAPNKDLLKKFNIPAEKAKVLYRAGKVIYDKHGKESMCEDCQGTGYVGRTGIFEMVIADDKVRDNLKKIKSLSDIGAVLRHARMLPLQEQALRKVLDGTTGINEMIRVLSADKKEKPKKTS